ncbi:MarR family winged helix-turn-helix transcriptional regulator [Georgenia faecalis]|uniref:MarR family winged helix-turn-helix transcriptional regulator n=1 Tax=Georgenia faecalis TaxID=2483799 RepID=A0ABV9D4I5_9MICO|nr:MarR family transcriptional regulator [Georgenia faecalis]
MSDSALHLQACGELMDALAVLVRLNRTISVDVARSAGLAPAQLGLLGLIDILDEARIADIADQQIVDPSVASRQVATLEQLGFVARRADPADGRASLVRLTDEGRAILASSRDGRHRRISAALADWSTEDLGAIAGQLRRVGQVIERTEHGRRGVTA